MISRRFTPLRIFIFLVLVAGYFTWRLSEKEPTPAAAGTSFNDAGGIPATQPIDGLLRVAAYNIDGGVGLKDGRLDLVRTADALRPYNLIGLEEVHGPSHPFGDSQAQILATILKLPWVFAPVERRWGSDAFGNAAMTQLPVTHWQRFPLAEAAADSNRNVLMLNLIYDGKPLNVIITHLERHDDHEPELLSVIELFKSLQEPAILMGDLNAPVADPLIKQIRSTSGIVDATGMALSDQHHDTVDWIFARGLQIVASGFTDNGASDHPLAWATFHLPQ